MELENVGLEEYCNSLPENALVAICIRLIEIAMPVWDQHVNHFPDQVVKVNALIGSDNCVQNGAHKINPELPKQAIGQLKRAIAVRTDFHESLVLKRYLATFVEPLTNPGWDDVLPLSVRLVYTAVYNLFTFLVFTRFSPSNESHINVAINQACDAIMREKLLSKEDLDRVLHEYESYDSTEMERAQVPDTSPGQAAEATSDPLEEPEPSMVHRMFASSFKKPSDARCPKCGSAKVHSAPVGIEFTQMHCDFCGYDDIADVWELDEWYR
nr:hypothetical protein [Candidatus Sigynarchaeota archaeon]